MHLHSISASIPLTASSQHDSYLVIMGISNGKDVESLVTIQDPVKHDRLRRSVAGAFSQTGVLELEDGMDETLSTLLEVVEIHKEIDLSTQLLWFSVDTAGRIAFSEDFGSLKTNSDHSGIIKVIHSRFMHWGNWAAMPGLERLLFHNPLSLRLLGQPSSIAVAAATKLQARLSIKESRAKHDLMQKFIEAGKTNPVILDTQGKVGMVMSTMSGAADTTATTMSAMIYYLLQNPPTMEKLLSELRLANLTTPIPKFSETRALPYLHAVTKEAMRLFPIFNIPMERTVPPGGVVLAGTFFPEGTCVGCLPSAVHRDRSIFGEDVDAFRPERWLDRDADAMRKMESIHLGFSRGKRVCLGQHIAIMQLKKVVPALLLRFKVCSRHSRATSSIRRANLNVLRR
jgi:cytochrome P450